MFFPLNTTTKNIMTTIDMKNMIDRKVGEGLELADWIDKDKLDWSSLSANPAPGAIALLKANKGKIDWKRISENTNPEAIALMRENIGELCTRNLSSNRAPGVIDLLREHKELIEWRLLSYNNYSSEAFDLLKETRRPSDDWWAFVSGNPTPEAIALLRANKKRIHWEDVFHNPSDEAMDLMKENWEEFKDEIDWTEMANSLAGNPNTKAIAFLRENMVELMDKIDCWEMVENLAGNPNPEAFALLVEKEGMNETYLSRSHFPEAIAFLMENTVKINWDYVSENTTPGVFDLLRKNKGLRDIDWGLVSGNPTPGVLDFLRENQDKINWEELSANPRIFV